MAQLRESSANNFSDINLRLCQALDTFHLESQEITVPIAYVSCPLFYCSNFR